MGTAALDKLLGVGDPAPQQASTSALDKLLNDNKPKPTLVQPVQSDGILDTLGNYAKYIYHLAGDKDTWQQLFLPTVEQKEQSKQMFLQTAQALGHNLSTFASDASDVMRAVSQGVSPGSSGFLAANPTIQKQVSPLLGSGVGNPFSVKNVFMGMAQVPIQVAETFTGTKNQEGKVVPATPDDEAKNIQSLVGMVVAGGVAGKVMKTMAPTTADLIATNTNNYPGLIVKAAYPKLISGLAAGASFGAIKDMGSEDQLGSIIGNSLAFATIGTLWRPFKASNELGIEVSTTKEAVREVTKENANQLLATRGLQITGADSPVSVGSKIKSYATSNDAIDAYINSNLTMGKQVVVEDLSEDQINRLTGKYMPSARVSEGVYRPSPETQEILDRSKFVVNGTKNKFIEPIDPFDRAILASTNHSQVLEELKDQTGLTEAEISSHRNYIKDQTKTNQGDFKPRSPAENAIAVSNAIDKGKNIISSINDGESFQDINGNKWTRAGNQITNGQQAFKLNDPATAGIIGTRTGQLPTDQIWRMPKQDFSPEYGRELNAKTSVYRGPNGETLISSYPLAKEPLDFFQKTGYQANELVTANGNPVNVVGMNDKGYVQVKDLTTGTKKSIFASELRRIPSGVDSEFYKADNGQQLTKMGILNRDNYLDNLYSKFKTAHFNLDEEPQEAYNTSIMKFAQKMGMKNMDDIQDMGREFYSRMVNDVIKDDPELEGFRKRTLDNMQGFDKHLIDSRAANLSSALNDQNMSLTHRGGGIYDIKDMESGSILKTVQSLDDAKDFINKSGQANGFDLDGGFSGGTPIIGGSLKDSYVPHTTRFSNFWDRVINAGGSKSTGGVPQTLIFQKSALLAMDKEYETDFSKHFIALQYAQNIRASIAKSNNLQDFISKSNKAIELGSNINPLRRAELGGELTKDNPKDLTKRFELADEDIRLANQIAKVGSSSIIDLMDNIRSKSDYKDPIGSPKFTQAYQLLTKNIDPQVNGLSKILFSKVDGSSKLVGILKLAQNIENGVGVINNITKSERDYLNAIQEAHNSTPGVTDPYFTHLVNSKLAEITGYNPFPGYSDQFLRQVNKIGSTNSNQIEIDPSTHLFNFRLAAVNTAKNIKSNLAYFDNSNDLISFKQVVDNAQKEISKYLPNKNDADEVVEAKRKAQPAVEYFQNHLDDVKGIPDLSDKLGKGLQQAVSDVYGKGYKEADAVRFGNALIYSSLLGLRPAFAARDMWNVFQNTVMYDSFEAGLGVMSRVVKRDQAQKLMDEGIIATQKGLEMLSPNESVIDGMGRLSKLGKGATKLSDLATKYNGQQLAHIQSSAGTYLYYNEKVAELSGKMLKNDISKQDAYTKLKIQKLPPEEQKTFDDLISSGRTTQAADMLARSMVDRLNVVYGRNNAPQAWNSWFGRLAGGFGQWVTHQINTNIDILARGTNRQILESHIKMAATNAAVMGAGIYTGVNLSRWMIQPFSLPGESPLMSALLGGVQGADNSLNEDPTISDPATSKLKKMLPMYLDKDGNWTGSVAHLYLPMSYFAQGIYDSMKMAQGDFGLSAGANALGMSAIKSSKSDLQETMGNEPEWQGKVLPKKDIGPKILRSGIESVFK